MEGIGEGGKERGREESRNRRMGGLKEGGMGGLKEGGREGRRREEWSPDDPGQDNLKWDHGNGNEGNTLPGETSLNQLQPCHTVRGSKDNLYRRRGVTSEASRMEGGEEKGVGREEGQREEGRRRREGGKEGRWARRNRITKMRKKRQIC